MSESFNIDTLPNVYISLGRLFGIADAFVLGFAKPNTENTKIIFELLNRLKDYIDFSMPIVMTDLDDG